MKCLVALVILLSGALAGLVERRQMTGHRCDMLCTEQNDPVCGSDGKTYSNLCFLTIAACQYQEKGMTMTLKHNGACTAGNVNNADQSACNTICDEERKPLCASDGNVYDNVCLFQRAQCEAAKNNQQLSVLLFADTCPTPIVPDCSKYQVDMSDIAVEGGGTIMPTCPSDHQYLCGSNGHTFANECSLCHHNHDNNDSLTISYTGRCHSYPGILSGSMDNLLNNLLHHG